MSPRRPQSLARVGVSLLIVVLLLTAMVASASGKDAQQPTLIPAPKVILRASTGREGHRVPAMYGPRANPPGGLARAAAAQPATIIVNYTGFTPEAQAAFAYAVQIWAQQISSLVPIVVEARWSSLGPGVLGAAGPANLIPDFAGAPFANTLYPIALANKISSRDNDPAGPDIEAIFNSDFSGWYFGTDANTPDNKYDFVSVVLHELGHGLGFVGGAGVDTEGRGTVVFGSFPIVYDRFTADGSGKPLLQYADQSTDLGNTLRSEQVYFTGSNTRAANGNASVPLYAPPTWNDGSSYSHLDESFNNTPNALMTFSLSNGEAIHDPGDIGRGILRDIGWTHATVAPTVTNTPVTPTSTSPTAFPTSTPTQTATVQPTPDTTNSDYLYLPLVTR